MLASELDNIGAKKSPRRSDIFFIIIVARICIVCFYRPETASGLRQHEAYTYIDLPFTLVFLITALDDY